MAISCTFRFDSQSSQKAAIAAGRGHVVTHAFFPIEVIPTAAHLADPTANFVGLLVTVWL